MISKGLTLMGSWHYNLQNVSHIWQVIRQSSDALDRLISHTLLM